MAGAVKTIPLRPVRFRFPRPSVPRDRLLSRMGAAYLLLGLAIAGAAAGLVLALSSSTGGGAPAPARRAAAEWKPLGIGSTAVRQIAQHVAGEYRLASGKPLAAVIPRSPAVQGVPIGALAIRPDTNSSATPKVYSAGNAVMYILCGSAQDCSIGSGTPSAARGELLRREALELSLDTFRYVDGVDTAIVFVPPLPGSSEKRLVVLRRQDLARQLARPLAAVIGPARTVKPGGVTKQETARIDAAMVPATFVLAQAQQLPDQTLALLLTPQPLPSL